MPALRLAAPARSVFQHPARAYGLILFAAAVALLTSCSFDLPPLASAGGGGSAGTGATAGSGGHTSGEGGTGAGTGGDAPPCTPPQSPGACSGDVSPTLVKTMPGVSLATYSRPYLAWSGEVWGVYTRNDQEAEPGSNELFTMARDGTGLSAPEGPLPHNINAEANLGFSGDHFAVVTGLYPSEPATVARFDRCGQPSAAISVTSAPFRYQEIIVGGSSSDWLVAAGAEDLLGYAVMADGPGSEALTPLVMDGDFTSWREFAAGLAHGRFYIAAPDTTGVAVAVVEPNGSIGSLDSFDTVDGTPRFVGPHGSQVVLVTTTAIALLDPAGPTLASVFPFVSDRDCFFASSGSELRRVCWDLGSPNSIAMHVVAPASGSLSGAETLFVDRALSEASIAWDGSGWGVAWYETEALAYAYRCGS